MHSDWSPDDLLGLYETHLTVRDLDRALDFYTNKLGLTLARQLPERKVAFL